MSVVQAFCEMNDIKYYEIAAPQGFEELVRKKGIFPNRIQKYCTDELKVKPMIKWRKKMKFTPNNARILLGVRADESKARAGTVSLGERDGHETIYPLAYLNDEQRDELIVRAGFDVLPTRSCECHPCIFESSKASLRRLEPDRVELIDNLEKDLSYFTNARRRMQRHPKHDSKEIFGMFNSRNIKIGRAGIKEQVAWANSARGKYKLAEENEDGLCEEQAGYCGG